MKHSILTTIKQASLHHLKEKEKKKGSNSMEETFRKRSNLKLLEGAEKDNHLLT